MASVGLAAVVGFIIIAYICVYIFGGFKRSHGWFKPVPGPVGLPFIGSLIDIYRAGYHVDELMLTWAKKYGQIFQFKMGTRSVYVLNDFQLISEAFHHVDIQGRPEAKFKLAAKVFGPGKGIFYASGDVWKEHRQTVFNCFRKFGLSQGSLEQKISEEGDRLTETISRNNGEPMNVSYTFSMASCNIMSSLLFNEQLDHDSPILKKFVGHVLDIFGSFSPAGLFNTSALHAYLKRGKISLEANKAMKINLDASIEQHLQRDGGDSGDSKDLLDIYLERLQESDGPDVPFSKRNLTWIVWELYLGGIETVSSTLRWATLLIMTHPEVQRRCQAELDDVVGPARHPTLADRTKLPYLNATILEVFRVGDVVPLGAVHFATADVDLNGYRIPKGSVVMSNTHAVMTDPSRWPEPEAFRPERHLDESGNFVNAKDIIPFGIGRRVCVGEKLARTEVFLWLSRLLYLFNFEVPNDGSSIPSINEGLTGLARLPLPYRVRFTPREFSTHTLTV